MKRFTRFLLLVSISIVLASCGQSGNELSINVEDLTTKMEIKEDDFLYRLVTEKSTYKPGEKVELYAELEYIGDNQSVVIYHAASPFYFDLVELTRDFEIDYAMEDPLLTTEFEKANPYRSTYVKSGGYSDTDSEEFIEFMKQFFQEDGFPEGEYVVKGTADFYTEKDGKKEEYKLEAQVKFSVGN